MSDLDKMLRLVLCIICFCACNQKGNSISSSEIKDWQDSSRKADSFRVIDHKRLFKPYKLNKHYTAIDTGAFTAGTFEGTYAIIERDGSTLDTIDLGYGIKQINDNEYLYYTLTTQNKQVGQAWPGVLSAGPDKYIAVLKEKKVVLKDIIHGFDNYMSVPDLIDGNLYFWQYDKTNNSFKISAARYNVKTGSITSHYLLSDNLKSIEHFFSPIKDKNNIEFYWEGRTWKFSPDLKLIN